MATLSTVQATTRYLRFPLAEDHRAPLQDGSSCFHCQSKRVQRWGRFSGRQRYRCRDCQRTFSTFTGTALHYLKKPERWPRFLWCVDGRLTVRSSAALLGCHRDTALRWRHRLLAQWRVEPKPRLKGRIVIGDFCMPHSDKGGRSLTRPSRRHGEPWSFASDQTGPVSVLVAWQSPAAMHLKSVTGRTIRGGDYDESVAPRLRAVTEIVGSAGPLCSLAGFARRLGTEYRQECRSFHPRQVFVVRRELRTWLRPFRGVATRRLDNYLEWFRRRGGAPVAPDEPSRPARPTIPADSAGGWPGREDGRGREGGRPGGWPRERMARSLARLEGDWSGSAAGPGASWTPGSHAAQPHGPRQTGLRTPYFLTWLVMHRCPRFSSSEERRPSGS